MAIRYTATVEGVLFPETVVEALITNKSVDLGRFKLRGRERLLLVSS